MELSLNRETEHDHLVKQCHKQSAVCRLFGTELCVYVCVGIVDTGVNMCRENAGVRWFADTNTIITPRKLLSRDREAAGSLIKCDVLLRCGRRCVVGSTTTSPISSSKATSSTSINTAAILQYTIHSITKRPFNDFVSLTLNWPFHARIFVVQPTIYTHKMPPIYYWQQILRTTTRQRSELISNIYQSVRNMVQYLHEMFLLHKTPTTTKTKSMQWR